MDLPSEHYLFETLTALLSDHFSSAVEVRDLSQLSVGFSWWTWKFDALTGGRTHALILRIGPDSGLLAPYDAMPEACAMTALSGSGVPVPVCILHGDHNSVFGAPFLLSERLAGEALIPWQIKKLPDAEKRGLREIGREFAMHLARIHDADVAAKFADHMGLDPDPRTIVLQQVDHWERLIAQGQDRVHPLLDMVADWLRHHVPDVDAVSLCNGDYRIGNFLVSQGQVSAVLDWEMVHLGDRHEDLAWALMKPLALRDIIPFDELRTCYRAAGGSDICEKKLKYFSVLSQYKVIGINAAGHRNFLRGSSDMRVAILANMIPSQIAQLLRVWQAAQN